MGTPATTGQLQTKIGDMQIGDYIICRQVVDTSWDWQMNDQVGGEIPYTGLPNSTGGGYFYFIKVRKGLLVADRITVKSVSWDSLNNGNLIEGKSKTFSLLWDGVKDISGIIRLLTGGIAYSDSNGIFSTINKKLGAWPSNNEWDKYIVNFPISRIQSEKTLDDVFHNYNIWTWCQETPPNFTFTGSTGSTVVQSNINRIVRGNDTGLLLAGWESLGTYSSNTTSTTVGFRPAFEYKEV